MIKKLITLQLVFFIVFSASSQDVAYARKVLNKLAGKSFYGRGYVKYGDKKAADYLVSQFEKNGINPLDSTYFQDYNFAMNTFPGRMKVSIDGNKLQPGSDFVISSSASTIRGEYTLLFLPDDVDSHKKLNVFLEGKSVASSFLVTNNQFREIYGKTVPGVLGFIVLTENTPVWSVKDGAMVESTYWIKAMKDKIPQKASTIKLNIENEYILNYPTQNIIAYVEGKTRPDRFIVFSAHYDHLGMMGKSAWFPGANDNASGTAMLMDLARHYAQPGNQPDYSIVFMAFSGEEAGLKGSSYYAENPIFPLESIQLLINLDMVGSGSEGITIVNGKAYKGLFDEMVAINEKNNYLPEIKDRGEACNSDHCPFYQKGVKAVFIYTRGKEHMEYHTVNDVDDHFPFTAYDGLFKLLTSYVSQLN